MKNNFSQIDLDFLQNLYTQIATATKRYHAKEEDFSRDIRDINEFQRDYARCTYSSSFRRLQGKMQLLNVQFAKFYRNRLTHSIEVATIAREIGRSLKSISNGKLYAEDDIYVLELASLMHDSGNPPFGHAGERVLNKLIEDEGGFEGNAQVLRLVTQLEKKHPNFYGLNLTARSLFALTKYYVCGSDRGKTRPKKFIYLENFKTLQELAKEFGIQPRTLDVQIMDLADEIAYAAHDLEDALRERIVSIDEIIHLFRRRKPKNPASTKALEDLVEETRNFAYTSRKLNTSEEYNFIFRKTLTSRLVNILINDIGIVTLDQSTQEKTGTTHTQEIGLLNLDQLSKGLKEITFECISNVDEVYLYEKRGEIVLTKLFELYSDTARNKDLKLLPPEYRNADNKTRSIIDYLSGMMDSFAFEQYDKYFNTPSGINLERECVTPHNSVDTQRSASPPLPSRLWSFLRLRR